MVELPESIIVAEELARFSLPLLPYIRHKVFDWYTDVKKLKPLNQEVPKHTGSILLDSISHLDCYHTVCRRLERSINLAIGITGLIAAYWIGKVATQFAYYPMYEIPKRQFSSTEVTE